ncbi:circularly permuted type 2 ATP-grasp protein [Roseiconus lacunae]|uniref:circularly permuted type 2 ATP-grasp protein n=1 Tax=Roseiconus lacunae TaxID=2605694 RepID=UPI001E31B079|nr:circularly permuted type 2 ATP-grasp protein [Roseiconus lacunae]MCD0458438.1 circularly permuted type 2 ATP-grasp protein [Roseiconus lacunae]
MLQSSSLWNHSTNFTNDFDERVDVAGAVRPHWSLISSELEQLGPSILKLRSQSVDQFIHDNGVTFQPAEHAPGSAQPHANRPWRLSVIPFLFQQAEWQRLREGLAERTMLLEAVLGDLLGPQRLIRERIIPGELLWSDPTYDRAYHELSPNVQKLHVSATDLARDADGQWKVIGDRTRAPSGLGYLLENRIVTSRVTPTLIRRTNTQRLASFFESLNDHLRQLAPSKKDNPRIALLTPPSGSYREFEDTYLARYLGLLLVQGSDLAVRDGELHMKTLGGLKPIQVLWRHISDRRCDPLELDPASIEGATGLLRCIRRRTVSVVNTVGSVLAQTPALMAYLGKANEFFFGKPLSLASAETYWCGAAEDLAAVLQNLEEFAFREAYIVTGKRPIVVSELDRAAKEEFLGKLNRNPERYIAQRRLRFSRTPLWTGDSIESQKVVLRSFQLNTPKGIEVLPGGLARAGQDELELARSLTSGGTTLDCWVTSDKSVDQHKTLLKDTKSTITIRRGGADLPSRVAEHLFWLGRYAERAESAARLLRTTLNRVSGEDNWETLPEVRRLIYALASAGQIEPSYAVEPFSSNLPAIDQVLPAAVLDRVQSRSLCRSMDAILHNAASVRDRLSIDAYRIIQRAARDLNRPIDFDDTIDFDESRRGDRDANLEVGNAAVKSSTPPAKPSADAGTAQGLTINEALDRSGRLIVDLLALAGLTSESVVRTHVWQFIELGRRIERAESICDLVTTMLCPPTENGKQICEAALEVSDCLMTYRSRYINLVQLAPVIDLLVTDETNPRSLQFQFDRIASLMDKLPTVEGPAGLDAILRLVSGLQFRVTTADPIKLSELAKDGRLENLQRLLEEIAAELPELFNQINARYLIHTESTQQLTGTER